MCCVLFLQALDAVLGALVIAGLALHLCLDEVKLLQDIGLALSLGPLQSSSFSFAYVLRPPRSALEAVYHKLTVKDSTHATMRSYSLMQHRCKYLPF